VNYIIGLAEAAAKYAATQRFVRRIAWLSYAAESWPYPRSVVLEVEHGERGANPRFLVTTLADFPAGLVYDRAFCPRGQSENFIKDRLLICRAAEIENPRIPFERASLLSASTIR
jgi:hypothetical protein